MTPLSGYGHVADLVLLVMVAEWVALGLSGRGWGVAMVALLPGALLVLALRAALAGAGSAWILLPLALSLPTHLLDLRVRRWLPGRPARARRAASRFSGAG